jgi:hypothetical protein
MKINLKTLLTDVLIVAVSVSAVLAVVLNVATSVHLGAPYIGWIIGASAIVTAIVKAIQPYASAKLKAVFTK